MNIKINGELTPEDIIEIKTNDVKKNLDYYTSHEYAKTLALKLQKFTHKSVLTLLGGEEISENEKVLYELMSVYRILKEVSNGHISISEEQKALKEENKKFKGQRNRIKDEFNLYKKSVIIEKEQLTDEIDKLNSKIELIIEKNNSLKVENEQIQSNKLQEERIKIINSPSTQKILKNQIKAYKADIIDGFNSTIEQFNLIVARFEKKLSSEQKKSFILNKDLSQAHNEIQNIQKSLSIVGNKIDESLNIASTIFEEPKTIVNETIVNTEKNDEKNETQQLLEKIKQLEEENNRKDLKIEELEDEKKETEKEVLEIISEDQNMLEKFTDIGKTEGITYDEGAHAYEKKK